MRKDQSTIILRLLALVCFFLFCVMTLRSSERASIFGRYSPQYLGYILEMLAYSICFGILSLPAIRARIFRRSSGEITDRFANYFVCAAILAIPVVYFIMRRTDVIQYFRYTIILLIPPLLAAWVLNRFGKLRSNFSVAPWLAIVIFFFILQFAVIILLLGDTPRFDITDEPWDIGNAIYAFDNPRVRPQLRPENTAGSWLFFPSMLWVTGAVMEVIGKGWLQARAFYLVLGLLACPFLYATARRIYGPIAGWSAALLAFFIPLHYNWARPDIWVATATAIAIYCYFAARNDGARRKHLTSAACGFFIVSTIEGHYYGIAFAIMFCLLHCFEQLADVRRHGWRLSSNFVYFLVGCLAFTIFWFWYHIALPGLQIADIPRLYSITYAFQADIGYQGEGVIKIVHNSYEMLRRYLILNNSELFLSIVLLVTVLKRRKQSDWLLLTIYCGSIIIFAYLLAHEAKYYPVFWMPFVSIWFGALVQDLCNHSRFAKFPARKYVTNGTLLFLSTVLMFYVMEAFHDAAKPENIRNRNHLEKIIEAGRQFDEILPDDGIEIVGNFPFYLGMPKRLNYHARYLSEAIVSKNWTAAPPEALILVLGYHEQWPDIADYINEHSFVAAACIPLTNMDNLFGHKQGLKFTAALFLHPDYAPDTPPDSCSPEMLAWLDN